ncbi:MAG: N-acetylmuramoyl-L-alanine amidase [Nitrospirales bacterium]|nr:N-acetylmuramoyl-L-alanine amidase [Nitrospirales bacterium]
MNSSAARGTAVRDERREGSGGHLPALLFSCFFFYCLLLLPVSGGADDTIELKGLRHWSTAEYTRVVIDLSAPAEFTRGSLSNPERLFFDLKNAKVAKDAQKSLSVNGPLLRTVRMGQFTAHTVRIVFDLSSGDYDYKVFNLEDPARLVVDISPKEGADPRQEGKPEANADTKSDRKDLRKEERSEANTEARLLRRRVVIDAGHGGHDPGAVGKGGLFEKDVVLDIALKVRDVMRKEYPAYEVILTRDRDIFIPLEERASIANRNKADFFVSIHANASPNRKARGIETYLLNWTNDEEAMKVAARENAISLKKMKQVQGELGVILASLERESKREDSVKLAGTIHHSLVSSLRTHYPGVIDLGVKQALFYVLVGAAMPSALVEVAFISNPEEERLLEEPSYRQGIASSIVSGIQAYFSSTPPPQRLVNATAPSGGREYTTRTVGYTRNAR